MIGPQAPRPTTLTTPSPTAHIGPARRTTKTTQEILASRPFWRTVTARACAGGLLGIILGSGFGTVTALESLKLENPVAQAAIQAELQAGKSPGDAIAAASAKGESIVPSLTNLTKHRAVLARTVGRTAGAFSAFIAANWGIHTAIDQVVYAGEPHLESVFGAALLTCVPAAVWSPMVRKNIPVLGFCVVMDAYHVFSERGKDED